MKIFPTKTQLLQVSNYLFLGGAVFAIGLLFHLPYDRLNSSMLSWVQKKTGYQIIAEDLSLTFPAGIQAKNARVVGPPIGSFPVKLEIEKAKVSFSPFSLVTYPFRKTLRGSFSIQREKERFQGKFGFGPKETLLILGVSNFILDDPIPLENFSPSLSGEIKISGIANLSLQLEGKTPSVQKMDFSSSNGKAKLTISNATLEDPAGVYFKSLVFDKISLDSILQKGVLQIQSLSLQGPSLNGQANGSITFDPRISNSQLKLNVKLNLGNDPFLKTLFSLAGASLGLSLDESGSTAFSLVGPMEHPTLER